MMLMLICRKTRAWWYVINLGADAKRGVRAKRTLRIHRESPDRGHSERNSARSAQLLWLSPDVDGLVHPYAKL